MKEWFIKAAAGTPDVRVADCEFNATEIIRMVHEMEEQGVQGHGFSGTLYYCLYLWRSVLAGKSSGRGKGASWYVLQKKLLMWTRLFL
mgnify:CR=1 FL=1